MAAQPSPTPPLSTSSCPSLCPFPRLATPSSCAVLTQPSPTPAPNTRHPPFSSSWTACGSWVASSRCRWSLGRGCYWCCLITSMPPLLAPSCATMKRRGELRGCPGGPEGRHKTGAGGTYFLRRHLWEFLGGPVVRTQRFHCWGLGSIPGQGTKTAPPPSPPKKKVSFPFEFLL